MDKWMNYPQKLAAEKTDFTWCVLKW